MSRPAAQVSEDPAVVRRARLAGLAAGFGALALYVATAGSRVSCADPAQFQTLAVTGGIAHGGYPLLVTLLEGFGRLPFGSVAFRANLLSCLSGAVAVGWAAWAGARASGAARFGLAGAAALALTRTLWSESTLAGVHAFTLAIDATLFALLMAFARAPSAARAVAIGLLGGFGLSSHLSVLSLLFVLVAAIVAAARAGRLRPAMLAAGVAGLAIGLAPLTRVPLEDRPSRPMNYLEDALALEPAEYFRGPPPAARVARAAWLLSGRQYLAHETTSPFPDTPWRVLHLGLNAAVNDLPLVAAPLGLAGLIALRRRRSPFGTWLLLWLGGALVVVLAGAVSFMVPIFFLPGWWVLSVGFAAALAAVAARAPAGAAALAALAIALPVARLSFERPPLLPRVPSHLRMVWEYWPGEWHPFRSDERWDRYGRQVMAALPPRAAVLVRWQEGTTLRYFRYAEPLREDVAVVMSGGHPVRVRRAIERAERDGRPVLSTFEPPAAGLDGRAAERLGAGAVSPPGGGGFATRPRIGLWRIGPPATPR